MRKEKVISYYSFKDDYQLATLAASVHTAITQEAAVFTDPVPSMEDFGVLVDDYQAKHELASQGGSMLQVRQKREARARILDALRQLAYYVNRVADGSAAVLVSSGLELAAQPKELQTPLVVRGQVLSDGRQSGQMRYNFTPVPGAYQYEYQVSSEMDVSGIPVWNDTYITTSSRTNVLSPVVPGTVYRVRIRAYNSRGYGDWSDTVSMMAR